MRDYSDKRGGREVVERKPVAKNRPRRESGGMWLLLSLLALAVSFGAGVGTGWLLFRGAKKPVPVAALQPPRKDEPAPAPQPRPDAPLTFYKTLPAGSKAALGTGLNLKKAEPAAATAPRETPPAPGAAPAASEPAAAPAAPAAAPVAPVAPTEASPAKPENGVRYLVQVASYKDKQEAVTAQAKLTGKGIAAYLVESKLPDKGVWWRLRVGRHLTKAEAGELAGKIGKGALTLPE